MMLQDRRVTVCAGPCGRPIWRGKREDILPGLVRHVARGLCTMCYDGAARDDTLADYPCRNLSTEELIEEIEASRGRLPEVLLEMWGKRATSVERVLYRAGRKDLAARFSPLAYAERQAARPDTKEGPAPPGVGPWSNW